MAILNSVLLLSYVALVLYGAWTDMRELRIPNRVSLALLVAFFGVAVSVAMPMEAIAWHLGAGLITLVAGFALFAFGYFGGGDAKLMAACALWIGWDQLYLFVFAVVLVGGVLSLLAVILRRGIGLWPDWLVRNAEGLFTPNKAIPYGIAIAAGAMILLPRMDVFPQGWHTLYALIAG